MISKVVRVIIFSLIFIPLISLLVLGAEAGFSKESTLDIFNIFINNKLFNSLQLAISVAILSSFTGMLTALIYYHIRSLKIRNLFLLMLLFLFATAPLIYTSILSQLEIFNSLSALMKSVAVLTLWLIPLASAIMILMMRNIDDSSLNSGTFLPIPKLAVFKTIIFKQSYFVLFGTFSLIFIMAFIQEDVPSFFGYRTYAEEFLSRIILMEKFESTLIYASPFILFAFVSSTTLYFMLKHSSWSLFQDQITPLKRLDLIKSEKFAYFGVTLFTILALFVIYQLIQSVNFSNFITLFSENIPVLINSLLLSFFASSIATLLAAYIVNSFDYKSSPSKMIFIIALLSLYWFLPSSLTALTILKLSQLYYIANQTYEYIMLLYGYVIRVLPIGLITMLILSQHKSSSHLLKHLNISKKSIFVKIILPTQWKGWLMVFGILFFLLLSEITTTVLLVPAGFETVIVKIYNLLHYGDFATVAFLSLLQIFIILIGLSIFAYTRGSYDKA